MYPLSDPSPSDVERLIALAREGDKLAWEELFHRCYPKVVRVVRRKLSRPMRTLYDSTDFASDVMKSFAARIDHLKFESFESLMAYLVEVARHKVIDEYRKTSALKRDLTRVECLGAIDGDGARLGPASPDPTASKLAEAGEARERIAADHDEPQREVIDLKIQGFTNEEISDEVGWHVRKIQRFFKDLETRFRRRA